VARQASCQGRAPVAFGRTNLGTVDVTGAEQGETKNRRPAGSVDTVRRAYGALLLNGTMKPTVNVFWLSVGSPSLVK
jgi:hypothetical protein